MNKTELVERIAVSADISKTNAARILDAFTETVAATMANGDKLSLIGFGTFETRQRNARIGRNPQTGKEINIPAANVPVFKAGKALKDAVN
ncbi:HU family DNA-binding protein [Vreelandella zhaodongensis]|uniref:HU family DNA-binding protein n=1 Tax=Vreelandella zhaodongensis TaxID=1176240 RepID=UPI003EBBB06A